MRSRLRAQLLTPVGVAASVSAVLLLALVVVAPGVWGPAAEVADPTRILRPPSAEHVFGTDAAGRDILLRTLVAARLSVVMALVAVATGVVTGVVLGLLPLLAPRRTARTVVAGINIAVAFPGLLLAIALSVVLGQNTIAATFAIAFALAPGYARLTHTLGASAWGRDFVSAARVLGVGRVRVIWRHVLPTIRDPLLVNATVSAGTALVAFASLSFLGLGVQTPDYDWGRMLNEGLTRIFVSPAAALVPGIAIVLAALVFTLVGETLSRALTPGSGVRLVEGEPARVEAPAAEAFGDGPDGAPPVTGRAQEGPPEVYRAPSDDLVLSVRDLRVVAPVVGGSTELVRGVSFDVARGEIVGVVGESGAGKSLAMLAAAGLVEHPLQVRAERIEIDGVDLPAAGSGLPRRTARALATRLALVYQDPMSSLNPALKVGTQVAEAARLHLGLRGAAARAKAVEALEEARVPEAARRAGQYPHELSGGLRQRVMIAMGLMTSPALLLADEPTTALDVTVQAEILDLLRRVNREHRTAIVLVSHDLGVVVSLCSRVLVMYRGRIVESVSAEDLREGRVRHPYTRGLRDAVPTMDADRSAPVPSIPEDADYSDEPAVPDGAADDGGSGRGHDG